MSKFYVRTEVLLPGCGAVFNSSEWFKQATVEEILTIDIAGWAADPSKSLSVPFWDLLYFYYRRPKTEELTAISDQIIVGLGTEYEQAPRRVEMKIDSYGALNLLAKCAPNKFDAFKRLRPQIKQGLGGF